MNPFSLPSFQFKKWPDGSVYEGEWVDGKRHGQGTLTCPDGSVYEGGWVDDKQHGRGTFTWSDGSSYKGEWVDGKQHGRGKYTWPDGSSYEGEWVDDKRHGKGTFTENGITVKGTYENDICISFSEVEIQKNHRFFRKDDGVLYYKTITTEPKEVSIDNKRLEDTLKQLGTTEINIKPIDDNISCENAEEFGQKITEHLKESSTTENTTIIKTFTIPGHGFVMIFKEGRAYCYDNGTIEQNNSYKNYKKQLESKKVTYKKISILNRLAFLLIDGLTIEIEMPQNSLVCRHLACIIYQKMQEFINNKGVDPIKAFEEYCEKVAADEKAAGEKQSPNQLVRCNSLKQAGEKVKIDCCTQSL